MQSTAKTCKQSCRQAKARFRVAAGQPTPSSGALRFGYADPPYIGMARRYYSGREVNHASLILRLVREYPDGAALSCSRRSAKRVLELIPESLDPRLCIWVKGSRQGVSYRERNAYECVVVWGGRPRRLAADQVLDDVLVLHGATRSRSHPKALIGMKPPGFWSWLFELLGATVDDDFEELFPGSGAGERAWRMFTGGDRRTSTKARRLVAARGVFGRLEPA